MEGQWKWILSERKIVVGCRRDGAAAAVNLELALPGKEPAYVWRVTDRPIGNPPIWLVDYNEYGGGDVHSNSFNAIRNYGCSLGEALQKAHDHAISFHDNLYGVEIVDETSFAEGSELEKTTELDDPLAPL